MSIKTKDTILSFFEVDAFRRLYHNIIKVMTDRIQRINISQNQYKRKISL